MSVIKSFLHFPTVSREQKVSSIPRDTSLDSSLALLREGYHFISNRKNRFQSDIFETRLMFKKVVCITGEEAGQIFYGGNRMTRKGAVPFNTVTLLQDYGSVQTLDDQAHLLRKQMFLSFLNQSSVEKLVEIAKEEWEKQISVWEDLESVALHEAVEEIFCRAVCRWAGLRLTDTEIKKRTKEFSGMIDGSGSTGFRNLRGQVLRSRSERWAKDLIRNIRNNRVTLPPGSLVQTISLHKGSDGQMLPDAIAAIELLNVLRPTVAVARFVTFAALALHEHPQYRERLHDNAFTEFFVQEVRRFYPFFPFIAGRVKEEFKWRGHEFRKQDWVIFDMYGTNHDNRIWKNPNQFDPDRFQDWDGNAYNFVPQGGGDILTGHRCPGESATVELMKMSVQMLAFGFKYSVPPQDFRISYSRMPAIPEDGFIIRNVNYGV
jgi:fatty-acid peroxygenase